MTSRAVPSRLSAKAVYILAAATICAPATSRAQDIWATSQPQTVAFQIPAQPLGRALTAYAKASGIRIAYNANFVKGLTSRELNGSFTPQQALAKLLNGTPLSYGFTGDNTATLYQRSAEDALAQGVSLETINVESATERVDGPVDGFVATRTATATKTSTPIVEVPQSISVVPQTQITAQGAQSLRETLRYTPGIYTDTLGPASPVSTFMRVRGFIPYIYLDGTRLPAAPSGSAYPEVETYNVERVEVLKGPASGLFGSSGPGGIVAATSKRPLDSPFREIAVQTGSFNRKQIQFDVSDRVNGSENMLFRVVGLARDADHQINYFQDNREFIAPSFTFKNDSTRLTLLGSYFHQDQRFSFYNYLPASGTVLPNPNGRISLNLYNGEPSFDNFKREQMTLGYAFEHQFNESWAIRQNMRYMTIYNDGTSVGMARAGGSAATNNDPRTGLAIGDATQQNVRRGALYIGADTKSYTIDTNVEGKFRTGAVDHTLVAGLDYRSIDSFYKYLTSTTSSTFNVFNPVYGATFATPSNFLQYDDYNLKQTGVYAQDQLKYNGWILTLGGRYDAATTLTDNRLNTAPFVGPSDRAFTGRAGLGYEFSNGIVPYFSYATSFDPAVGATFSGEPFKPTTGKQYEAGVKWQPPGSKTLVTAAAFDLTQQNVLTRDPINTGSQIQTGEVHIRGFEFEARTELFPRFDVIAGYAYLNAEITKSNIPGEAGQRPNYTPEHQAALWAQYRFSGRYWEGLTLGGGVRYVGSTQAFVAAATYAAPIGFVPAFVLTTPSYTLFDAMLSYDLAALAPEFAGTNLRINATNLFDTYYIAGCSSVIQCAQGNTRSVIATLSYKW